MASYIPQQTDTGFSTPLPTYDWGFLQANQQKKEQQYTQGLSEVVQGYNAIASQQVLDEANKSKKAEWLKAAQEGLKKLSTSDLSLPKNVAQAEALYSPFYSDNLYLQDVGFTKYSQGELSKLDGWKNSNDKDTRDQYNPYAERYIQQGMEDFSMYNRDPEKYKRIQKRAAVPFADVDADIDKAYKEEQQKGVSTVTTNGPMMTTEINGIKSKDAFRTYYLSHAGNKYDEQFRIIGSVKAHDSKSAILRQNPDLDEKALNEHFAKGILDSLGQQIVKNRDSYIDQASDWGMKYNDLKKQVLSQPGHIMHPDQEVNLALYRDKMTAYQAEADNYSNQYKKLGEGNPANENYQRQFEDISLYPEQYIASVEKQIQADNWASGMASMSASKVEANPVWVVLAAEMSKAADRKLRAQEIQTTQRGQTLDWMQKTGRDLKGNLLPGANPALEHLWYGLPGEGSGNSGVPNPNSGQYLGRATVDVAHLPTGLDILNQVQEKNKQQITNSVYDINGIAGALKTAGLTANEIIDFTEGAKAMESGQHPNSQQAAIWDKVKGIMKGNGMDYAINGPQAMTTALITYAGQAGTKLYNSGTDEGRAAGQQLLSAYMSTSQARDKFLANEQAYKQSIHDNVTTNPIYKPLLTPSGTVITTNDIKQDLEPLQVYNQQGQKVVLTPEQMAKGHMNGDVDVKVVATGDGGRYQISIGKDRYLGAPPVDAYGDPNPEFERQNRVINHYISKYGDSKKFSDLMRQASADVLPNLKEVKDGLIAREIGWDPTVKSQNVFATGLSKELANPANTGIIYTKTNDNIHKPVAGNTDAAVRSILSSADDIKAYTTGPVLTIDDNTGEKAYYVQFRPDVSNDKTTTNGVSVKGLAGQRFYIPVSPNAEGSFLESVPPITSMFTYGDLLYGKTLTSDPVIESSGMRYSIKPYDKGPDDRYTKAYVNINRTVPDPVNPGKSMSHDEVNISVPMLSGANAKSPDEIVNAVHGQVINHTHEVTGNSRSAHRNVPAGGKTFEQFEKEHNQ